MISPTVGGNPWLHYSTPIEIDLQPVTIATRVLSIFLRTKMECHSPWRNVWAFLWKSWLPKRQDPPLGLSDVIQRKAEQYAWHQIGCRKIGKLQSDRLRDSTPVFSFGVDSLGLSYPLGDHKAMVLFDP